MKSSIMLVSLVLLATPFVVGYLAAQDYRKHNEIMKDAEGEK